MLIIFNSYIPVLKMFRYLSMTNLAYNDHFIRQEMTKCNEKKYNVYLHDTQYLKRRNSEGKFPTFDPLLEKDNSSYYKYFRMSRYIFYVNINFFTYYI